ncbi:MAG: Gldg family protein [Kofleriaceae bacterium]|nr:Gldg family protein [Kofleriaceae bacterium]
MMWSVIKKELRGYFDSAVALLFLAAFLAFALYMFFWHGKFFARGLADLRPLFEWLPLSLIILVSALAMRVWADERRAGTLEVLLTLPIPRWQLVLGKFAAGMILVATGLALTLGLPITVSMMGNLDTGPVLGGYLAALLLSAAYLVIGMCVSATTDNQIVAFVGTAFACAIAFAVGETGGELGRLLGTGTRFESIARGVLDLRDLAYYAGIVAVGLAVNVLLLQRLAWSRGPRTRARRMGSVLAVGLVLGNAIALGLWLQPVKRARIDLTEGGTFSLSAGTEKILAGLDEQLLIRGYFSAKTHPELEPLVPQIRDLLDEYRVAGGAKVRVELVDPSESDDAKREAKERFGIDPTPLRFATQTEKSVVNAYFNIAIEYGDQHAVLGLDDLITVRVLDIGDLEIGLRNLEYQVTKTIKKTVDDFASVDALFASIPGKVQLTAYLTPKTLPDNWKDAPQQLQRAVDTLTKQAGGKLAYTVVEPTTEAKMQELFRQFGLRPYSDLLSGQVYYFHLLLQVGDRMVRIVPPQQLGEADLERSLQEGLKRAAPGFTRVVGLWSPPAPPPVPMMEGMPPRQMPPPQSFRRLREALSGSYEVRDVDLASPVPDDIESLVLAGPASFDAKASEHVDQYLMRGGALVLLAGRYRLAPASGLAVEKVSTGLEAQLTKWGVTLGDEMVMDTKSDAFPVPQERDLGNGLAVRELVQLPYPFFVKMDGEQLASGSMITSGLTGSVLHWASPVKAESKVGDDERTVDVLLRSSRGAWLTSSTQVEPDQRTHGKLGFPGPANLPADKKGAQPLAVAITGGFASAVAPADAAKPTEASKPADTSKPAPTRLLSHSPPDARLVVFGSSAFVSDDVLGLAQQLDSDFASANVELVHNAVDWSLADTDLLAIRSRTSAARALTIERDARASWRNLNLAIAFLGLALVVGGARLRRRAIRPITEEA